MKMNRYIKAMEIGLANEKEGISYFELLEKMQKDLGYTFNRSAEATFLSWFDENFESVGNFNRNIPPYTIGELIYLNHKYGISGDIIDSQEIKQYNYFYSIRSKKIILKRKRCKTILGLS